MHYNINILLNIILLYNVVKERGGFVFVRAIKNNKGRDNTYFCALVESYREGKKIKHRVLINFGLMDAESVPFLKAAYSKKKPRLVWDDEKSS